MTKDTINEAAQESDEAKRQTGLQPKVSPASASPLSDTPRTDAVYAAWGKIGVSMVEHACQLERENAELRRDAERYTFLCENRRGWLSQHAPTSDVFRKLKGVKENMDRAIDIELNAAKAGG